MRKSHSRKSHSLTGRELPWRPHKKFRTGPLSASGLQFSNEVSNGLVDFWRLTDDQL